MCVCLSIREDSSGTIHAIFTKFLVHVAYDGGVDIAEDDDDDDDGVREFGAPLQISTGFASWQRYCTASSSGRQPNFAALNRGRHLCSAGRPSRWALVHILMLHFVWACTFTVNETISH